MTKAKKVAVDAHAERAAVQDKGFKVGQHVSAQVGVGTRRGTITDIEMPEDVNKSPMIQFTGANEKGEEKTYRHRPTLVERD